MAVTAAPVAAGLVGAVVVPAAVLDRGVDAGTVGVVVVRIGTGGPADGTAVPAPVVGVAAAPTVRSTTAAVLASSTNDLEPSGPEVGLRTSRTYACGAFTLAKL